MVKREIGGGFEKIYLQLLDLHVEYMLENNGMNPDSARRKVRRLRKLECKPCSCLMMDIIINMGIPPEQIINTEPF